MVININCLKLLFFFFLAVLPQSSFAAHPPLLLPTQYSQIAEWKNLGGPWALGLDSSHRPLALYDLSYRNPERSVFIGCLDLRCAHPKKIARLLEEQRATLDQLKILNTADVQLQESLSQDLEKALEELNLLETTFSQQSEDLKYSVLPKGWWKGIPWKNTFITNYSTPVSEVAPPESFSLENIDFETLIGAGFLAFKKELIALTGSADILSEFQYVGTSHGGYRLFWNPRQSVLSRPKKMADIRCPQCALSENFSKQFIADSIQRLISLIPVPAASALVSLALGEWFHLKQGMNDFHQQRLIELLNHGSETAGEFSQFSTLDPQVKNRIAAYLVYSRAGILDVLSWLAEHPTLEWALNQWTKQNEAEEEQARQTATYLKNKNFNLKFLNSVHVIASTSKNSIEEEAPTGTPAWIYPLSTNRYWNLVPPFAAVDYQKPDRILHERVAIEAAHLFVGILSGLIPIPFVGTVISQIYERIVHSQMHAVATYEARLDSVLETRLHLKEDWTQEMNSIRLQTVNPFIRSYEESLARISETRTRFHIPLPN